MLSAAKARQRDEKNNILVCCDCMTADSLLGRCYQVIRQKRWSEVLNRKSTRYICWTSCGCNLRDQHNGTPVHTRLPCPRCKRINLNVEVAIVEAIKKP